MVAVALEILQCPARWRALGIGANMLYAQLGKNTKIIIVARGDLGSQIHD
jgi:hypothetical protein